MQKTVKEIIDMINAGQLHYNQSTQRKFVYANMEVQLPCGKTTKAGSLINAILEDNIQLPALYFWHNTDTNQLNIHDGKQRILSLYYFINSTTSNVHNICTIRNGRQTTWYGLSPTDQQRLLDYTFDIVERSGTSLEEERSFYLINSNPVPLTAYECVAGMFHGTFLETFENYIESLSKTHDKIKPINRGEQAYKFLLTIFNLADDKKGSMNKTDLLLNDELRKVRNNIFDPTAYSFDKISLAFCDILKAVPKLKEDRALSIVAYCVRAGYNVNDIIDEYRKAVRGTNDIDGWDIATHKTYVDALVNGTQLDPQRYFNKDTKDILYAKSPRCAFVDSTTGQVCKETSYSKLEVDHIVPWSKGGRTIIGNAQLLCKVHNTSKGNRA